LLLIFIKYGVISVDNKVFFEKNFIVKNNTLVKVYLPSYY